jgi:predicted nucleotidyltransferase
MSLTTILFTDYRRRVLGLLLLHPERAYHLREIARLTGTVPGTLGRELTKLTDAGVLVKHRVGNQLHYSANRDCPIYDELASILRKTSGLADVLAGALLPLAEQIHCAFVFGSMASGKAGSHSDIDLMVIGSAGFTDVSMALYPAQETLGREINPKVYTQQEWQTLVAQQGAFVKEILTKPRLFILGNDKDLDSMMKESGHGPR